MILSQFRISFLNSFPVSSVIQLGTQIQFSTVTWLWMFLVVLSSHANRQRHIQMTSIFVYKHKVNRWLSTSNCQGWQIYECPWCSLWGYFPWWNDL